MIALIGWFGTCLYLLNHGYISFKSDWQKSWYYGGNAVAALCLTFTSYLNDSWQALAINGFWAFVSVAMLMNISVQRIPSSRQLFFAIVTVLLMWFIGQQIIQGHTNIALLGWIGAFIFTKCYLLFSQKKLTEEQYLWWNALAAIILLPQLWQDENWPSFALEVAWAMISIYGASRHKEEVHLVS